MIADPLFSLVGLCRGELVTVDGGFQSLSDCEAEVAIRREGDCFALWFSAHREIAGRFAEEVAEGLFVRFPLPEERAARALRRVGAKQDQATIRRDVSSLDTGRGGET